MSDTRTQLEEERRIINAATEEPWKVVTRRYSSDIGWYDASHIPGVVEDIPPSCDVEESAPLDPSDATFIAHARTALPLRNAQVAAVLAKCDEITKDGEELMAEWHERGEESDEIELLSQGADLVEMARVIRRAIEEAGA